MSALIADRNIYQEGVFTFAHDQAGLFNASALVALARQPELSEFLSQPHIVEKIFGLAESLGSALPPQWRDPRQVRAQNANYMRALRAVNIGYLVPGSVGRKAHMVSGGNHSIGEVDFGPGFWLHTELALDLAEWMSRRVSPTEEKPLVEFVKRALARAGLKSAKQRGPKCAAQLFLVGVSDKLKTTLKSADESMIEAGESFEDRRAALADLLKSVKGGQK